jgi:hypothetical protein
VDAVQSPPLPSEEAAERVRVRTGRGLQRLSEPRGIAALLLLPPPPRLLRRAVAVQVAFGRRGSKPVFLHFIGSRVETGWFPAVGQMHSSCAAPTARLSRTFLAYMRLNPQRSGHKLTPLKKRNLKPGNHSSGSRVVPRCFQAIRVN